MPPDLIKRGSRGTPALLAIQDFHWQHTQFRHSDLPFSLITLLTFSDEITAPPLGYIPSLKFEQHMGIFDKLGCDVALYLGGNSLQIGTSIKDFVSVPAFVAYESGTKRVLAVGDEAEQMLGKEPSNISNKLALKLGVPSDLELFEALVRYCLKKYIPNRLIPPRVVVSGQMDLDSSKKALSDTIVSAGARDVLLLEAPMAAAIGLGLKVEDAALRTILHFEKDWMLFSIISLAGVVSQEFEPIGGDTFLQDISICSREVLGFAPDQTSLNAQFIESGFDRSISPIGWEAWTSSIETGKELAGDLDSQFITKACSPTFLRIREVYGRCLSRVEKEKRIQLNASPIHLSGRYANIPHFATTVGNQLGREAIAYRNSERAAYDGTVAVLSEIKHLTPYVAKKKN